MTKAELLAAAEALEQMAMRAAGHYVSPTELAMLTDSKKRAAELRAQAATAGASMTEPVTYSPRRIAWELERTAMKDTYFGNALRVAKDIPGVTDEERALLDRWATGAQTAQDGFALQDLANKIYFGEHPAPAPASLRDMTEADFDKAHGIAPAGVPDGFYLLSREDGTDECLVKVYTPTEPKVKGIGFGMWDGAAFMPMSDLRDGAKLTPVKIVKQEDSPAAGVPDVAALVDWLRWKYSNIPDVMKAATALAALQSQLAESKRSEMWLGNDNDSWKIAHAQQAERIKKLEADLNSEGTRSVELLRRSRKAEAKLTEAVGLLEKAYLWVDSPTKLSGELTDFLAKAREVMG